MRDRRLLLGSLTVVVAASGFGLLGPLARFAYDAGFDPLSFVAWRATFGLLCVLVVIWARARRGVAFVDPRRLPRSDQLGLVAIAASAIGLNVAMFFAFDLTTIAIALLAFYTYPALVAVVAVALGHEQLDGTRVAALILALAGMVLVVAGGLTSGGEVTIQPLGVVFAQPGALAIVAFTGIFAAGIPSILFLTGIRAIGGTRAGILMLFEPLVGVTLAALLLHEALTPVQVTGGVAILAAAILLQRGAPAGETIEPAAVPSVEHG